MGELLKINQILKTITSGISCKVKRFIGCGGQGEVYLSIINGKQVALKWYFPWYIKHDYRLKERLETAIKKGPPSNRFLWPMELVSSQNVQGFGYIMPLREQRFKSINALMDLRINPSFHTLTTVGFELAHSFWQLHAKGLCYRDISFGNIFFDPNNGEVRICDNDNTDVNKKPGAISGTPRFMAPEIVRGDSNPDADTDLFSLSVLLFYMFMFNHPLEGKKEDEIHCLDPPAMEKLYGINPVFIFDPNDNSNSPVPGVHDNAIKLWNIYPKYFRDRFIKAFTNGIHDPRNGRIGETVWRSDLVHLRDSIIYCPYCKEENFYDIDLLKTTGKPGNCWSCNKELINPVRIRINQDMVIMLNYDTKIYQHHVDNNKMYDFSKPVAEVTKHPKDSRIWGLKNLSNEKWTITTSDGRLHEVELGHSVTLETGTKINFGKKEGVIRY